MRPLNPTVRELRWFAALQLPFWGLVAWLNFRVLGLVGTVVLLGLAGLLTIVGLLSPLTIRGVYRVWMTVAFAVQTIISCLLMGLLFFGLILPIGLILRYLRPDPLQRSWPAPQATGWHSRPEPGPPESYLNQY
ncbi:hypothetical protein GC163_21955 [bacterium]|nr:hypothetical protein [bacterium]